ncbi:MAG: hypothetical protein ACRC7G_15460 [Beijerinckiaceae bacterium]
MTTTPDLFGHTPAQGSLFSEEALPAPAAVRVDPEMIRRKLEAMLADLRGSQRGSPWPQETTRANRYLFPQMSNWLPEAERDQLRFAFEGELKRLHLAA